jgi:hypothetical protein
VTFDPPAAFADAATEAAKTAIQETLKSKLGQYGFSALFISVSEEMAKSLVGHLIGPLLGTFLKLIDPTQKKLDVMLAEPLQTGIRSAQLALSIRVTNPVDEKIREQHFVASLQSLEKAHSYAQGLKSSDEAMKIRLIQAAVAKSIHAAGAVQAYLEEYRQALESEVHSCLRALKDLAEIRARLESRMGPEDRSRSLDGAKCFFQKAVKTGPKPWIYDSRGNNYRHGELLRLEIWRTTVQHQYELRNPQAHSDSERLSYVHAGQLATQHRLNELKSFQRFWQID